MMFHARAPSSAALENMLMAMSEAKMRDPSNAEIILRKYDSLHKNNQRRYAETNHSYITSHDVNDDDQPVKVKVECPPRGDTVFSFRIKSKAA